MFVVVFTFNRLVFPIFTLSPPSFTFRLVDVIHSFILGSRPVDGGDGTSVTELSSIKSLPGPSTHFRHCGLRVVARVGRCRFPVAS